VAKGTSFIVEVFVIWTYFWVSIINFA
jgi:hypothetical protein